MSDKLIGKRITFRLRATIQLGESPYTNLVDQEIAITVDNPKSLMGTEATASTLLTEAFTQMEQDLVERLNDLLNPRLQFKMDPSPEALMSALQQAGELRQAKATPAKPTLSEDYPRDSPNPL